MIQFKLNGQAVKSNVPSTTNLLTVLSHDLQVNGTKFGCGAAQCGACTVHIDGQATRSCVMPVAAVEGKRITTIEAVTGGQDRVGNAVREAWVRHDVAQCGYCQSGQIMTAAALVAKTSNPSDADINEAMRGNLCRCGTYPSIRKAIHRAAQLQGGRA